MKKSGPAVLDRDAAGPVRPDRHTRPNLADSETDSDSDSASPLHAGARRRPLYAVSRMHLDAMSDDLGIWQHARGAEPDPRHGYCTDDVARAIVVDVLHSRELRPVIFEGSLRRSIRFLSEAFNPESGRFLNLRTADGQWLDADASEDCHARALLGLAMTMAGMQGTDLSEEAGRLFDRALPAAASFGALRAISAALLACDSAIDSGLSAGADPVFAELAARLESTLRHVSIRSAPPEWPWPEPTLTYENAIVPRALIAAWRRLGQPALLALGCSVLDWLIDVQAGESGQFSPIGNSGWWSRGAERGRFDQQPIEAATMVSAAAAAFGATGRRHYLDAAEAAYGWFLGDNDLGVVMADPIRGACYDGLTPTGPNRNQGAESTLMWLTALEQMRELRRGTQGQQGEPIEAEPRSGLDA